MSDHLKMIGMRVGEGEEEKQEVESERGQCRKRQESSYIHDAGTWLLSRQLKLSSITILKCGGVCQSL